MGAKNSGQVCLRQSSLQTDHALEEARQTPEARCSPPSEASLPSGRPGARHRACRKAAPVPHRCWRAFHPSRRLASCATAESPGARTNPVSGSRAMACPISCARTPATSSGVSALAKSPRRHDLLARDGEGVEQGPVDHHDLELDALLTSRRGGRSSRSRRLSPSAVWQTRRPLGHRAQGVGAERSCGHSRAGDWRRVRDGETSSTKSATCPQRLRRHPRSRAARAASAWRAP